MSFLIDSLLHTGFITVNKSVPRFVRVGSQLLLPVFSQFWDLQSVDVIDLDRCYFVTAFDGWSVTFLKADIADICLWNSTVVTFHHSSRLLQLFFYIYCNRVQLYHLLCNCSCLLQTIRFHLVSQVNKWAVLSPLHHFFYVTFQSPYLQCIVKFLWTISTFLWNTFIIPSFSVAKSKNLW